MLNIIRTTAANQDFQDLVKLLDEYLAIVDGEQHLFYAGYNKIISINHAVVAYDDEKAVGCGAIKKYDDNTAEVKRMYVLPDFRGRGIAYKVLLELESWAAELNYSQCILETGKKQTDAVKLYQKAGYNIIPNYSQYKDVYESICMKKILTMS